MFQVVIKVYSINTSRAGQLQMPQDVSLSCTTQRHQLPTRTCPHLKSEFNSHAFAMNVSLTFHIVLDTTRTSKFFTLSVKQSHGLNTSIHQPDKFKHPRGTITFNISSKSGGICSAKRFIQLLIKKW